MAAKRWDHSTCTAHIPAREYGTRSRLCIVTREDEAPTRQLAAISAASEAEYRAAERARYGEPTGLVPRPTERPEGTPRGVKWSTANRWADGEHWAAGPILRPEGLAALLAEHRARKGRPEVSAVSEPYMTYSPPPCPECGGPADDGAGHDCEAPEPIPAADPKPAAEPVRVCIVCYDPIASLDDEACSPDGEWMGMHNACERASRPCERCGESREDCMGHAGEKPEPAAEPAPVKPKRERIACRCGKLYRSIGDDTIGATYHATWTRKAGSYGPQLAHFIEAIGA